MLDPYYNPQHGTRGAYGAFLKSAFNKKRNQSVPDTIGGIAIGTQGSTGIYPGYTMLGGNDFLGALDLFTPNNPTGKFGTTGVYSSNSRSKLGALSQQMDTDPFYTGAQDSNQGVPIVTDTMVQSNSIITLKSRIATAPELPFLNGRVLVSSMIHTGAYLTCTAPCILEAYIRLDPAAASQPGGTHITFWTINAFPLDSYDAAPSPGGLEFDFPENQGANFNAHGTTIGPASSTFTITQTIFGNGWHLFSMVLNGTNAKYYLDGVLVRTVVQDCTNTNRPYYILVTNHITSPNLSQWTALGSSGSTVQVDYIRMWMANSTPPIVISPISALPTQQYASGASISYVFPSTVTLFGSTAGITDYCQSIRLENMEPGANTETEAAYLQFPSPLSWNGGTRTLTGIPDNPGRLNMLCTPMLAGGNIGVPVRGYVDIGPKITTTTLNIIINVAMSYNLYPDCNCGTLWKNKAITVTGLPTGLSFDPATFLITGTPTSAGTTSITIGVTNFNGQTASKNVNIIVYANAAIGTITGSAVISALSGSSFAVTGPATVSALSAIPGLTIDGTISTSAPVGSTIAATLSTTLVNDIIVVVFEETAGHTITVSSVADTAGLTWTRRVAKAGPSQLNCEIWWAYSAGILTSDVVTVTGSATLSGARLTVFGVNGVSSGNYANPWDVNVSLPASISNANSVTESRVISTTATNTMLISVLRSANALGTLTRPSGFASIVSTGANQDCAYNVVSSAQSSVTETFSWTGTSGENILVIDAIQQ